MGINNCRIESKEEIMKLFFNIEYSYYKANSLYRSNHKKLASIIMSLTNIIHASDIDCRATIGKNVHFGHRGLGIVIHKDVKIGDNCHIMHGVTIGGKSGTNSGVPIICNNVFIGINATLLGNIKVLNNSKIGAHAVVLTDVEENSLMVGIPARNKE